MMGVSGSNGAQPCQAQIKKHPKGVLVFLGGPGRNRPGPRMSILISHLAISLKQGCQLIEHLF